MLPGGLGTASLPGAVGEFLADNPFDLPAGGVTA